MASTHACTRSALPVSVPAQIIRIWRDRLECVRRPPVMRNGGFERRAAAWRVMLGLAGVGRWWVRSARAA